MEGKHTVKPRYLILALLSFFACSASLAVESATVVIKTKDGKTQTRVVKAQKIDADTNRIVVSAKDIPDNFEYLDVVADTATAKKGEPGFWIFARGETGSFKLDKGRYVNRDNRMPIFGMRTPRETFVAIIKGLKLENWLVAEADKGVYKVYPRWDADYMEFKPYEDIVIDFVTLRGKDANYGGMGRVYRKYMLESGKVRPFRERMKDSAPLRQKTLRQIATAMPFRIQPHSIIPGRHKEADFTPETIAPVKARLTFADAEKLVDAFKNAGMDDVHFCDAGWQSGGFDGKVPELFPIDECVGGEAALKRFVKYAQSQGYQMCANCIFTDAYKCSKLWDEDYVSKTRAGRLRRICALNGGWMYDVNTKRAWEVFIKKQIEQTRGLGYEGVLYIDVFSARKPLPSFGKYSANREEQAKYQNMALAYSKKLFGGSASECGCDHCAGNLDYINYVSPLMKYGEAGYKLKSGKIAVYDKMIDRVAPLWEIVYHGIILSNPDRFTQGILKPASRAYLRLVEFGGRPIIYNTAYDAANIARYKSMYDMFQPLKRLQLEFMEDNRELAPKVFLTRYGNGTETVVNYGDKPFEYGGLTIPPRDYRLFEPAAGN